MMDSFLKTSRLNYQLTSQFKNIYIQDDFFQKGILNITSKKGISQIDKADIQKIKGHITAHGFLKNFKNLNVQVVGKKLLLERLEFLKSWINSDLTGFF